MLSTTISDFRKDIKKYLDKVSNNFETLIINRGKDSGIVIISYSGTQKATGGTVTSSGGNTIHSFTGDGTFTSNVTSYIVN